MKPLQEMKDGFRVEPKLDMEYLPRKISIPKEGDARTPFEITRHHLDTNHHVNNGQYVYIALEYPEEDFEIRRLRAEYKKQAYLGDMFYPVVYKQEGACIVSLNDEKGEPYAVVELTGGR